MNTASDDRSSEMVTKRLSIEGRVQGVYFRQSMCQVARRLGVKGWVRNRLDDTVEATVQGNQEAVDRIIAWAGQGPEAAHVTNVQISDADGEFDSFDTLPTC